MNSALAAIGDLIDVLPDAALVVDAHGVIVLANDAVTGLLGHAADRLVGEPVREIRQDRSTHVVFRSVCFSMAWSDLSRPLPDCL